MYLILEGSSPFKFPQEYLPVEPNPIRVAHDGEGHSSPATMPILTRSFNILGLKPSSAHPGPREEFTISDNHFFRPRLVNLYPPSEIKL